MVKYPCKAAKLACILVCNPIPAATESNIMAILNIVVITAILNTEAETLFLMIAPLVNLLAM